MLAQDLQGGLAHERRELGGDRVHGLGPEEGEVFEELVGAGGHIVAGDVDAQRRQGAAEVHRAGEVGHVIRSQPHEAGRGLAASILAANATEEQRARLLRPLARGKRGAAAFALTEPGAGSDAAAIRTTARRDGDGWVAILNSC